MSDQSETHTNSARTIITTALAICMGYAILRYHIFGPVPWKEFPLFIMNKGVSLSAFILLTFNFGFGPLNNLGVKLPDGWLNARIVSELSPFAEGHLA